MTSRKRRDRAVRSQFAQGRLDFSSRAMSEVKLRVSPLARVGLNAAIRVVELAGQAVASDGPAVIGPIGGPVLDNGECVVIA